MKNRIPFLLRYIALTSLMSLVSCSESWKLMPAPIVHQHLGADAFRAVSSEEQSQDIEILYATNRPPTGESGAKAYGDGATSDLRLGRASVRMGEPGLNWQDVLDFSILEEREDEVPLEFGISQELDSLPTTSGSKFISEVERALRRARFKEITLYVHGAKSTFLRSTVQGAQFHHFMARNTAFISFSWPSTGSFRTYRKDVEYAAATAPAMAEMIRFLAKNTSARRINILAYSAGAQVVAPALTLLADDPSPEKLRIGEVYFAASDVGMRRFVTEYLPTFSPMVEKVTVTYHAEDSVLKIARWAHGGEDRLGRPDGGELSPEEIAWLVGRSKSGKLDVIDMEYAEDERPVDFKAHGYWYLNSWVSSDAILQFLFHAEPDERGLRRKPGSQIWYFPEDYPKKLRAIVDEGRRKSGGPRH